MKKQEKKSRSVIKGITYRLLATMATFTLAYAFTGDLTIATEIGFLDFFIKFTLYYLNERVWTLTNWGYKKQDESNEIPQSKEGKNTIITSNRQSDHAEIPTVSMAR